MYRRAFLCTSAVLIMILLVGCDANFYSIYRPMDTRSYSSSIDAKQRVIVSNGVKICAEPSPDALSAMSLGLSGSGSYKEVGLQIASSLSEATTNIGLRTQTIQLLRDGMYRVCEAHMNGALDGVDYAREQRRFQILMGGLLAIEQLTGVVVPKQVTLSGASSASAGKNLLGAQQNLAQAKSDLKVKQDAAKVAQKDLEDAQKALADYRTQNNLPEDQTRWSSEQKNQAKPYTDKVDSAKSTLKAKTEAVNDAQSAVKEQEDLVEAAKSLATQASTTGTIDKGFVVNQNSSFSEDNYNNMISAVQQITQNMFQPDLLFECFNYYSTMQKELKSVATTASNKPTAPTATAESKPSPSSGLLSESGVEKDKGISAPVAGDKEISALTGIDKFCNRLFGDFGEKGFQKYIERYYEK